jgi:hypothetical protein
MRAFKKELKFGPFEFLEASDRATVKSFEMPSRLLLYSFFSKKTFLTLQI